MNELKFLEEIKREKFLSEDIASPDQFPHLYNLSSAFIYQFLPRSADRSAPEFVYIGQSHEEANNRDLALAKEVKIHEWNYAWEAGQLRYKMFGDKLPDSMKWLSRFQEQNIYLLPRYSFHRLESYAPILLLLSCKTCIRFGLPLLKRGLWPPGLTHWYYDKILPRDFDQRLSKAFAYHIWKHLITGSYINAFGASDPLVILGHNLDYWLPFVIHAAEERLRQLPRVEMDDQEQVKTLRKIRKNAPQDAHIDRPRMGGTIWMGEEDAAMATREIVESADSHGKLRAIIDAVRSNRVEDDFSDKWSYEKEDFERKLYRKRSKMRVTFVELDETIPVQGPDSEVEGNLVWEDFLALLNKKEKNIVVLIRSGITQVGEISKELGYANHSPVSKALKRIRRKAKEFIDS